ncbi:M56 family metallopeptidase [Anoxybacterium hadale]|uniref:M56 family metallopeptidase n=1 Tax=Anoxybacterium hadale TaxID=3408580 RepID=UPI003AFFBEED
MADVFLTVLNMSITAGFAALIVLFIRGSLGRVMPQLFSYGLWMIVLYRMVFPFSFPSIFSVFGDLKRSLDTYTTVLKDIPLRGTVNSELLGSQAQELMASPIKETMTEGAGAMGAIGNAAAPTSIDSIFTALMVLWIAGILILMLYNGISYIRLCRSLATATLFEKSELTEECRSLVRLGRTVRVFESDKVENPFVYGILSPKVALPASICKDHDPEGQERLKHILLHEFYHIKRWDYLLKPLAFLVLCIHWFNPVLWLAFRFFDKDMEMSCDEGVVTFLSAGEKENYAVTLLNMALAASGQGRRSVPAFHANDVKERVKHIVAYKKPGRAAVLLSAAVLILCAVGLLSNPISLATGMKVDQANVLVLCNAEGSQFPDTILLLGYDADREGINVAFVPRDLLVGEELNGAGKLSGYAANNPPQAVVEKLGEILGIEINHYVRFDTGVFRDLVDAAGGVEFDVPTKMVYDDPMQNLHIDLQPGKQILDGKKAEMLVRFRKGYKEGDLARINVQKEFLEAALAQKGELNLPAETVYRMLSSGMETDLDMKTAMAMITLLQKPPSKGGQVNFVEIPVIVDNDPPWMLHLDPEKAGMISDSF